MRRTRGLTALGAIATLAYVIHHVRGRARQREPRADSALPTARFEPVPFASEAPAEPEAMVAPMDEATSAASVVTSADSNGSPAPALASSASDARADRLGPIELPPKRRLSAAVLVTLAVIAAVAAIALAATAVAASRDSDDTPESIRYAPQAWVDKPKATAPASAMLTPSS